jgi:CubicO group peptidase (beta-lactamase class C family)
MTAPSPIAAAIEKVVQAGELAGAGALVWRGGEVTDCAAIGWRDKEAGLPVERDTIFRIASMSKPITSAAALMVLEERGLGLDEPITRWAPEFSDMRVLRAPNGPLDQTDPAARPITFDDLLTHRSGLTYGGIHFGPLDAAYDTALGGDIDSLVEPDDWIAGLGTLPLIDQPGADFHYGHSTDLLGLLIARMDGAPLEAVLSRRLFEPLGMTDTHFTVPREKWGRRSKMYGFDEAGRLIPRATLGSGPFMPERPETMTFCSGGQGLWSTVDDYLAFARLFLGDGAVDGARLMKPETLALMTANRLTEAQRAKARMLGMATFTGHGFGAGLAVVMDPAKAPVVRCKGGVGTVGWPGAYGGWWQADPSDGSVLIFLAHNGFEPAQLANGIGLGVYGAIEAFHALAAARTK